MKFTPDKMIEYKLPNIFRNFFLLNPVMVVRLIMKQYWSVKTPDRWSRSSKPEKSGKINLMSVVLTIWINI